MAKKNFFKGGGLSPGTYIKKKAEDIKKQGMRAIVKRSPDQDAKEESENGFADGIFLSDDELEAQRGESFEIEPLIKLIITADESDKRYDGADLISSLKTQTYGKFETGIIEVKRRGRVQTEKNLREEDTPPDMSMTIKKLVEESAAEYIMIVRSDSMLAPNALYEAVRLINEKPGANVIYADEDSIDSSGERHSDMDFKPPYNRELLNSCNYIGAFMLIKREIVLRAIGDSPLVRGAGAYDLMLRISEFTDMIFRIPKVLIHNRKPSSGIYDNDAGRQALAAHFERLGIECRIKKTADAGYYRVISERRDFNNLTLVISSPESRGEKRIKELQSLGTSVRYDDRMNQGTLINLLNTRYGLFVRDFRYVPSDNDIAGMMEILCRKDVAAVGVKTVNEKGEIVQSGLVYFENGLVRPAFCGLKKNKKGYMNRASLVQFADGVSFDCVLIRRDALELTGGIMDMLPSIYCDMDICLQFKHSGFKVVVDPRVCVEVRSSRAPGEVEENRARLIMRERWGEVLKDGGIFYNPNFKRDSARFELL